MSRRLLSVFLLHAALAVAFTWPLVAGLGRLVPADLGDPLLNTWIAWWNTQAVPLTSGWWNAPAFHPATDVFAFSEHLLGLAWITSPVQWAGGSPLVAYNVAFLATWVLSGVTAWMLGYELTGRHDAAIVGSIAFAYAPYRAAQASHVQVLASFWMPLALVGLHRYARTRDPRWLVLFAAAWALQGLSNGYFLVFFGFLVVAWMLWFTPRRGALPVFGGIALASIAVAVALLPWLLKYREVHERYGFERRVDEIARFSADLLSWVNASGQLALWGWVRVVPRSEGELFPGLALLLVIAIGLAAAQGRPRNPGWLRASRVLIGIALLLAIAAAVSYGAVGRWRVSLLGVRISLTDPMRALVLVPVLLVPLVLTRPGLGDAIRRRSVLLFYLAAAAFLWTLALGPQLSFADRALGVPGPYALVAELPGFSGLRVPARFWMVALVCLSAAASLAYARWPIAVRWRRAVLACTVVLLLSDGWVRGLPLHAPPRPWPALVERNSAVPLLQIPMSPDTGAEVAAMIRAIDTDRRVVNGYSGHFPPAYAVLLDAVQRLDPSVFDGVSVDGDVDVFLDRNRRRTRTWVMLLAGRPQVAAAEADANFTLVHLARSNPAGARPHRGALRRPAQVSSFVQDQFIGYLPLVDEPEAARGRRPAGTDIRGDTLVIDAGEPLPLEGVRWTAGPSVTPMDYPRALDVARSMDGREWEVTWSGGGAGLAYLAALREPRAAPFVVPLDGRPTRFVRIRQTGQDAAQHWSIGRLDLIVPSIP